MTTTLPLTNQAQAMIKELQRTAGLLSNDIEQALQTQAAQAQPGTGTQTALDCDVVEKILLQALPAQAALIHRAKGVGLCHHPDKTNGSFLTQILSLRIEKETHNAYQQPAAAPVRRDPLYATFTMAPDADIMLLFNARDVDAAGNPLLMKIVARENVDTSKLDLSKYRLHPNGTKPDIVRVKQGASYVETKDIDEAEFAFGDPLKQVSLNKNGDEISTSVWVRPENVDRQRFFLAMRTPTGALVPNPAAPLPNLDTTTTGDRLDRTGVVTFDERIRLTMTAKSTLPAGTWLDTADAGAHVDVGMTIDRGLIFEPGSQAQVTLSGAANATLNVAVDKADAHLLGNASASKAVSVASNATLRQILTSTLTRRSFAQPNGTDAQQTQKRFVDVLFADAATRRIGGRALAPLADVTLTQPELSAAKVSATARPLPGDPEQDGATIDLTLDEGFLSAAAGTTASFEGWTIVAGFVDEKGQWQQQARTVGSAASKKEAFTFSSADFDSLQQANKNLEIRLFNKDGVPAQRVLVPFREIHWAT